MLAVIETLKVTVDDPNPILRKISSVCTDGTNVNTGEKKSLWVLLDEKMRAAGSKIPLTKIWCAAHRSELAWKSASGSVPEVSKVLSLLSSMTTYFHYSAIRTLELKKIASEHNLHAENFPNPLESVYLQSRLKRSCLVECFDHLFQN